MIAANIFRGRVAKLRTILTFVISLFLGSLISRVLRDHGAISDHFLSQSTPHSVLYKNWLHTHAFPQLTGTESNSSFIPQVIPEAHMLHDNVRLFCFSFIETAGWRKYFLRAMGESSGPWRYAKLIRQTWGKRCNKLVFFSDSIQFRPKGFNAIELDESGLATWMALKKSLTVISERFLQDYDWFVRFELDSFLIPENLRYYLFIFEADKPHYLGYSTSAWFAANYNAYDGGVVLSRGALLKLGEALKRGECWETDGKGDRGLGNCLAEQGIYPPDTRDRLGRGRFLPSHPEDLLLAPTGFLSSFWSGGGDFNRGPNCCSDYAISFHNIEPDWMAMLDYFIYHMKPYGKSIKKPDANLN